MNTKMKLVLTWEIKYIINLQIINFKIIVQITEFILFTRAPAFFKNRRILARTAARTTTKKQLKMKELWNFYFQDHADFKLSFDMLFSTNLPITKTATPMPMAMTQVTARQAMPSWHIATKKFSYIKKKKF